MLKLVVTDDWRTAKEESESKDGAKGEMDVEEHGEVEETEELWSTYELTGVITHKVARGRSRRVLTAGAGADGGRGSLRGLDQEGLREVVPLRRRQGEGMRGRQRRRVRASQVSEVEAEEVKKLYGGGDWHMAYMCLYKRVRRPLDVTKYE